MSQDEFPSVGAARPHILCETCRSFWERATCLTFSTKELSGGGQHVPSMPQHLFHSSARSEIRAAAQSGCHFCSILLGTLAGCTGSHEARERRDSDDSVYIMINVLNEEEGSFQATLLSHQQSEILSHDQIISQYPLRLCRIESTKSQSSTVDESISSQAQTCTYSQATADLIKTWVLECQANHPLCGDSHLSLLHGPSPSPPGPRRLLDLLAFQTPERIRLINVEDGQELPYCALSYSWGLSQPYVMTSLNLGDFQNEIHLSNLPKTFRDAIKVARGIGFRYLWTDALCITQDGYTSPLASEDWLDQAGKMNDIFGSSIVKISASEAHDGSEGFITQRNPLSQTICRLDLETKLRFEVIPPCTPHCAVHPFHNAQYHLDTRSWVLQERLLSARTVHFTRNFVHLECRTNINCEAFSEALNCHHRSSHVKADYENFFAVLPFIDMEGIKEFATESFLSTWHQLVRKYSTTNLSRPSDLLVALAGLTKPLQDKFQLTWSFGLCRQFLLREMLWYVRGGRGMPPSLERAPTWSWASVDVDGRQTDVDGPQTDVDGPQIDVDGPQIDVDGPQIDVDGPQILYEASPFITVVATITAMPEATAFTRRGPFSVHESRFCVKVRGLLKFGIPSSPARCRLGAAPSSSSLSNRKDIRIHPHCRDLSFLHPECPFHPYCDLPDESIHLYSLLVARCSDTNLPTTKGAADSQGWNTEIGLVLTPTADHPRRYRRVGYFHHKMQDKGNAREHKPLPSFFDDELCKIQEIEIV